MRTLFKTVSLLGALLFLVQCGRLTPDESKFKAPEAPNFKMPEAWELIRTCEKSEAEIEISSEAKSSVYLVRDTIESKDIETKNCKGEITKTHGPVRSLRAHILIKPPQKFSSPVRFVKVESLRTCSISAFDAQKKLSASSILDPNGTEIQMPIATSESDEKGLIRLSLDDGSIKMSWKAVIREGDNVLKIQYFGKCLKERENLTADIKSQFARCEEAEPLGSKEVLVNLKVERPEVPGVEQREFCLEK